jgi:transcriptional regulator with XRE-family HTH domain
LENIDNLSQHQIADKLGISQSTVSSWHHGICVPRAISLGYYKHALPSSVTVTPELMRLFGYYVAEGYARKEIDFCFNLKETKYVEDVKNLMNKIFGLKPDRIRNITKNAINIVYHSKPLAKFFIRHCGKGAKEKHFPPFLWEAPREYFLEFLRGYLSGDGHLDKRGRWEITSINKNLIIELNWLCRMHGIKTYVSKFRTKAGRKIYDNIIKKSSFAWRLGFSKSQNPFNDSRKFSVKRAIVKRVRKMPYEGYVYDLCGCDNEAFFGGETPILLHNTNRPDMLDPALLRPGRFDRQILVPAPDEKARLKILEVKTKNMPLKNVDLKLLAKKTENFSGADLEALCREAAMNALRENKEAKEVTMKHFENALKNISPSLSEPIIEFYKKFDERYKKKVMEETRKEEKELSYVG